MVRINLLPDIKRDYLRSRRVESRVIAFAVLVVIVSIGLVVVLAAWVYGAQELHKKVLTDSIAKNITELKAKPEIDKYVTVQNQLKNIDKLHEEKAIYSRLFEVLAKLNPKDPNNVQLSSVAIDSTTKLITLEGTTKNFTGIHTFRDTLINANLTYRLLSGESSAKPSEEKLFSNVTVVSQGVSKTEKGEVAAFKITMEYNTNTFSNIVESIIVSVPNRETTQSKIDAPDILESAGGVQ